MNIQFVNRDKQNEQETEELFSHIKPEVSMNVSDEQTDGNKAGKSLTKEEKSKRFSIEYEKRMGQLAEWMSVSWPWFMSQI